MEISKQEGSGEALRLLIVMAKDWEKCRVKRGAEYR